LNTAKSSIISDIEEFVAVSKRTISSSKKTIAACSTLHF
jgi:hypothetical protein